MLYAELFEGRDAPLYHATDAMRAANILASNRLRGLTNSNNAYIDSGRRARSKAFGNGTGISLSRDRTFAHHWWQPDWPNAGRVVLVFNQAKMLRDGLRMRPERHPESDRYGGDQSEEFLFGSLDDVDRYLDAIEMTQDTYETLKAMDSSDIGRRGEGLERPGSRRVQAMLRNPKLRIIPGRERNRSDPRKALPRS